MIKLNNTTYKKVAKNNPKDLLVLEVGDSKDLKKFQPQIKICRWGDTENDNECNVSIRLKEDKNELKEKVTILKEDGKIKHIKSKRECHFYEIQNEEHPEGASEFEVILKEKPKSNVVQFTVVDKGVDYFYQPALTPEEIAQGASRPENVVGSYAIYAKTPKTNWAGRKEYKVGKVGHIFHPKIIDSAGTEVWGELNIENGILSVTIPQEFLDNAVYPVRHAAGLTFGYTSVGATHTYFSNGKIEGSAATGANGTVSSISYHKYAGNGNYRSILYTKSTGDVKAYSNVLSSSAVDNNTWVTSNLINGDTSISGVDYWITIGDGDGNQECHCDTSSNAGINAGTTYNHDNTPPDIGTSPTLQNFLFSIYATYTAGGGASGPANLKSYNTNLKANIKTVNTNPIANVKSLDTNV